MRIARYSNTAGSPFKWRVGKRLIDFQYEFQLARVTTRNFSNGFCEAVWVCVCVTESEERNLEQRCTIKFCVKLGETGIETLN
jgi:hypothetical protein